MSFLRLKCTKFDFGYGSTQDLDPDSAPPGPEMDLRGLTYKGTRGRKGKERAGRRRGAQ